MIQKNLVAIRTYLLQLQNEICKQLILENMGGTFIETSWKHQAGGGGLSRILKNETLFEGAGVNFSDIHGDSLPTSASTQRQSCIHNEGPFQALGVSVVIHPRNPFIPTTHANVRFIIVHPKEKGHEPFWWFGGGFDLTPYYPFEEDCVHWHKTAKKACEPFGDKVYEKYKNACDAYFYLKHRCEARGIGGLFFDDVNSFEKELGQGDFETCFAFMQSIGNHFLQAYLPIIQRRKNCAYTEKERAFQLYRRGRYVEFNLLYDRGTLFGLQSGGRVESILMSLPPLVCFDSAWETEPNSPEEKLTQYFLQPRNWLS